MSTKRGVLLVTLALVGFPLLGLAVSWTGTLFAAKPLPDFGALPAFSFTERSGKPFRSEALRGQVWVASFLFTSCRGQCPLLAARLRELQKAMQGEAAFRLVSFTVDPERDTAEALAEYAKREGADGQRWLFLTGPKADLSWLLTHGFRVTGGLEHSSHFVLVDGAGRSRGFYDANDAAAMKRLVADAKALLSRG